MSTPTRCFASQIMTELLIWRNPQGPEENWWNQYEGIENIWFYASKVITTEVALIALATVAIVECIAYNILIFPSRLLYPCTDRAYTYVSKRLDSSLFTLTWSLSNALFKNLFTVNLMTHETLIRSWIGINREDRDVRNFVNAWERQYNVRLRPQHVGFVVTEEHLEFLQALAQFNQEHYVGFHGDSIERGATLILEDVLDGADEDTRTRVREYDPGIYMFVLTRTIFIYVLGARCHEQLPDFLKYETRTEIVKLRREISPNAATPMLQALLANPVSFEVGPQQDSPEKATFDLLRNAASEELQGSSFITRCWNRAIQQMAAEANELVPFSPR